LQDQADAPPAAEPAIGICGPAGGVAAVDWMRLTPSRSSPACRGNHFVMSSESRDISCYSLPKKSAIPRLCSE
jgi:hypothetical protein